MATEVATMTLGAAVWGLAAGLAGVAAMTAAEKLEQRFTHRPNSFVPGHTMERLMRLPPKPDEERLWMNWAMHWGQGVLLGAVRGLMAERGVRGPVGSFAFMNLRLLNDQSLENATGVGAPRGRGPSTSRLSTCCTRRSTPSPPGRSPTGSSPARRTCRSLASDGRRGSPTRRPRFARGSVRLMGVLGHPW